MHFKKLVQRPWCTSGRGSRIFGLKQVYVESCTDICAIPGDTKKKEKQTDYENAVSGWNWSEVDHEHAMSDKK